jgi:hypothetical protein
MKAITLHQPWAGLCFGQFKPFVTRSWSVKYRGLILIHSSPNLICDFGRKLWSDLAPHAVDAAFRLVGLDPDSYPDLRAESLAYHSACLEGCEFGRILGIVELVDCVPAEEAVPWLSAGQKLTGNFSEGRWAWKIKPFQKYSPTIPEIGHQNFWDYKGPLPSLCQSTPHPV